MMLGTPQWRSGVPHLEVARVQPPNPVYVDTVGGSVSGTGTKEQPVNSLALAIALTAGFPDWVIEVKAPVNAPLRQENTFQSTMNLTMRGWDHEPWHVYGSDQLSNTWTKVGQVYQRTLNYTSLTQVVVTSLTETIGGVQFNPKLLINTATPTTPGLGEFGYAAGVLYVRLWDDSAADAHTFEIARRNTCIGTTGFGRLTIEDVVARHALVNCLHNGLSGQPVGTGKLTILNSLAEYAVNGGVGAAGQNEETICTYVTSRRIGNDGFNLHANSGRGYMELNGCAGGYCGDKAGQSAQGASNHESTHMVLNGGSYDYNVSGGMVVIESARCDIHGDTPYGEVKMFNNMRLGNTPGPVATQAGCAWVDSSSGEVTGLVTVAQGQGVGVRAGPLVTGARTIVSTGNALPDVIS